MIVDICIYIERERERDCITVTLFMGSYYFMVMKLGFDFSSILSL